MKKTKILATIGPASLGAGILAKMLMAGMDAIRLNTAHGEEEQHYNIIKSVRSIKDVPIILDLKGPEIRIISSRDYMMDKGDRIRLSFKESSLYLNHKFYSRPGTLAMINDGLLKLRTVSCTKNHLVLEALEKLIITNKTRLNIPGLEHNFPALSNQDKRYVKFAAKNRIDYIALSYVRSKESVIAAKKLLKGTGIGIISKIETQEGVDNFDGILHESDGIMVARGDLGVEITPEKLPKVQKHLINKCNNAGKFVITATQMLQSMISNSSPTRAETSDVANAILDGTDVLMLSAETAIGKFPDRSVEEMKKIAHEIENEVKVGHIAESSISVSEAMSNSIRGLCRMLPIDKIITFTRTGYTARMISRFRLRQEIIALTPDDSVRKKLIMYFGVFPQTVPEFDSEDRIRSGTRFLLRKKLIQKEDLLLFTAGVFTKGSTNLIEVHRASDIILGKDR